MRCPNHRLVGRRSVLSCRPSGNMMEVKLVFQIRDRLPVQVLCMSAPLPPGAQHAPATMRNRAPILEVLRTVLPEHGLVLEIASGTGEHASFFAQALPGLVWQPSDPDADCRASITAHAGAAGAGNVLPALDLDVSVPQWQRDVAERHGPVDAALCINLVHITAWTTIDPMMTGVAELLADGGCLLLYGPFRIEGRHTAPSNAAFDTALRTQNPSWGVRNLEDLTDAAASRGLIREQVIAMPANNQMVVYRKR